MSSSDAVSWTREQKWAIQDYRAYVLSDNTPCLSPSGVTIPRRVAVSRAILRLERAGVVAVYQDGEFAYYEPKFYGHERFTALGITEDQFKKPPAMWFDGSINFFVELCDPNAGQLNPRGSFDRKVFDRLAERLICHGFRNIDYFIGGF